MGVVYINEDNNTYSYNTTYKSNYLKEDQWKKTSTHPKHMKVLTPISRETLKNLNLKVTPKYSK